MRGGRRERCERPRPRWGGGWPAGRRARTARLRAGDTQERVGKARCEAGVVPAAEEAWGDKRRCRGPGRGWGQSLGGLRPWCPGAAEGSVAVGFLGGARRLWEATKAQAGRGRGFSSTASAAAGGPQKLPVLVLSWADLQNRHGHRKPWRKATLGGLSGQCLKTVVAGLRKPWWRAFSQLVVQLASPLLLCPVS